jgi:hypothetical protein
VVENDVKPAQKVRKRSRDEGKEEKQVKKM